MNYIMKLNIIYLVETKYVEQENDYLFLIFLNFLEEIQKVQVLQVLK